MPADGGGSGEAPAVMFVVAGTDDEDLIAAKSAADSATSSASATSLDLELLERSVGDPVKQD